MREIELKVLNVNKSAILRTLKKLRAKREMKPTLITELAFRRSAKQNFLLRLRQKGSKSELTYKKEISRKRFKIEEEIETEVADFKATEEILIKMGFKVFRRRQKIREEFECRGVEVEIDTYPGCKPYIELEGGKKAIFAMLKKLGYSMKDTTSMTASEVLKRLGKNPNRLVFKRQPKV